MTPIKDEGQAPKYGICMPEPPLSHPSHRQPFPSKYSVLSWPQVLGNALALPRCFTPPRNSTFTHVPSASPPSLLGSTTLILQNSAQATLPLGSLLQILGRGEVTSFCSHFTLWRIIKVVKYYNKMILYCVFQLGCKCLTGKAVLSYIYLLNYWCLKVL